MKTQCPTCHSLYPITEDHLGRSAKCKKCGSRFVVQAFNPLDAIVDEVEYVPQLNENIAQNPSSSFEPPIQEPPSGKKKKGGNGIFPVLTVLLLVALAVLCVILWMKLDENATLLREQVDLQDRINQLQAQEKSRKKQERTPDPTFDFRHSRWGMTKSNVIASQGRLPDDDQPDTIEYQSSLMGKKALITYGFLDGRLNRAQYTLTEIYVDPGENLVVYEGLKVILNKKYGRPEEETAEWRNKTFFQDQSQWGQALAQGHVTFLSQWETKRTTIKAILTQKDGQIICIIEYTGKVMSPPGGDGSDDGAMNIL